MVTPEGQDIKITAEEYEEIDARCGEFPDRKVAERDIWALRHQKEEKRKQGIEVSDDERDNYAFGEEYKDQHGHTRY